MSFKWGARWARKLPAAFRRVGNECAWPRQKCVLGCTHARLAVGQLLLWRNHTLRFAHLLRPSFGFNKWELRPFINFVVSKPLAACKINLQESHSQIQVRYRFDPFPRGHMFSTPFLAVPMRRVARDATAVATVKHTLSRMSSPRLA